MDSKREVAYRLVAWSTLAFAGVALISVAITLPIIHNYVQAIRNTAHHDADYCKVWEILIQNLSGHREDPLDRDRRPQAKQPHCSPGWIPN